MSKQLTLSVIIPAYNEQYHLTDCLDAIAKQTEPPNEVIVVNNNSTDKTESVAKSYPFVRLLKESHQGVAYARDRGFDTAKSDIIGRIDADTILPPEWVATVKSLLTQNSIAGVTGPVGYYDMPFPSTNYWIDHQIRKYLYRGAPHVPFLFGSNSALRRSIWLEVRDNVCHDKTLHEDLDLAIHVSRVGKILYDKALLASTSARRYDDDWSAFSHYMEMYINTFKQHQIRSIVPRLSTWFYWLGYLTVRPFRRTYDPVAKRHSLSYARSHKRPVARKNPMH